MLLAGIFVSIPAKRRRKGGEAREVACKTWVEKTIEMSGISTLMCSADVSSDSWNDPRMLGSR